LVNVCVINNNPFDDKQIKKRASLNARFENINTAPLFS
jgi:hypothetical protein